MAAIKVLAPSTALIQFVPGSSTISSGQAIRKGNGYLGMYVGMFFGAENPILVPGAPSVWQVTITFQMYNTGPFILGTLDINALTGEVVPLSKQTIAKLQARANALAQCPSSSATS